MNQAPAVILVRPTEEGNVGAVARAMANTGLDRLVLVEPAVRIGATALARAVSGAPILEAAVRSGSLTAALASFRHVVGTTSQRERSFRSRTIAPRQLPERLASGNPHHTALIFGPERSGLTTEELALCGTVVRIPTASEKSTLNLAQAVRHLNCKAEVGVTIHGVTSVNEARCAFKHLSRLCQTRLQLDLTSYGLLVDDLHVYRAIAAGRPIGLAHPQAPATRALMDVAGLLYEDARSRVLG